MIDFITPNEDEARYFSGKEKPEEIPETVQEPIIEEKIETIEEKPVLEEKEIEEDFLPKESKASFFNSKKNIFK